MRKALNKLATAAGEPGTNKRPVKFARRKSDQLDELDRVKRPFWRPHRSAVNLVLGVKGRQMSQITLVRPKCMKLVWNRHETGLRVHKMFGPKRLSSAGLLCKSAQTSCPSKSGTANLSDWPTVNRAKIGNKIRAAENVEFAARDHCNPNQQQFTLACVRPMSATHSERVFLDHGMKVYGRRFPNIHCQPSAHVAVLECSEAVRSRQCTKLASEQCPPQTCVHWLLANVGDFIDSSSGSQISCLDLEPFLAPFSAPTAMVAV